MLVPIFLYFFEFLKALKCLERGKIKKRYIALISARWALFEWYDRKQSVGKLALPTLYFNSNNPTRKGQEYIDYELQGPELYVRWQTNIEKVY